MENNIRSLPCLEYIGHTATFYVPQNKLCQVEDLCHQFFIDNYDAYTCERSNIQGYWRNSPESPIFKDNNVKYVVSFSGSRRVIDFVLFLSSLCRSIEEESIYLTMGNKAWLVKP